MLWVSDELSSDDIIKVSELEKPIEKPKIDISKCSYRKFILKPLHIYTEKQRQIKKNGSLQFTVMKVRNMKNL